MRCRVCPPNTICDQGKIAGCTDNFKLVGGKFCLGEKSNPMEERLFVCLAEMDNAIASGKTFEFFKSSRKEVINGNELIDNCLHSEETTDESRSTAIDALATLLESFNSAGTNRYCMQ